MSQTISVSLPSSTLYVSGSVNGVDKVWTNTEGNTWETTADKSADGKYLVALVIVSSTGSREESFTLYYGVVSLITDRTEADERRAEYLAALDYRDMSEAEKAEWDADPKGAYNASDLNRVESAVEYLAGVLRSLEPELRDYAEEMDVHWEEIYAPPYDGADINPSTKTNWQQSDEPKPSDMTRYLGNVKLLRGAIDYATDALPESMDEIAWSGANAIERALMGLDSAIIVLRDEKKTLIDNTAEAWFFSGEIFSGEV